MPRIAISWKTREKLQRLKRALKARRRRKKR